MTMADTSQAPNLSPEQEEAAFYHEASLNSAWTGSRLLIGSLSFGFGAFVFAFFYLKSLNSHGLWYPPKFTGPQFGLGTTITVLIVVSALVQWAGLTRIKAAQRSAWLGAATLALVLGVVAVCLMVFQLIDLPFWPGASGFASVFVGATPVFLFIVLATMVYLEILIMRCRAIPQISFVEQPPTFAEAFAVQRFQAALSGFTLVWNYLAVIAVVVWVLFYLVH
jgi:heme/copper-type cytochrome/quinol oxidase subunit 3